MDVNEHISAERTGGVTLIRFLFAELSLQDVEDLKKVLYGYAGPSANNFVIDLHKCVFLSSLALGLLVGFTAKVHSYDGRVVLCSPTKEVTTLLDITKLGKIYDIYETPEAAIRSFRQTAA